MLINERWQTYLAEGYPQIPWGVFALGIALSGNKLMGHPLDSNSSIATFVGIWVFLLLFKLVQDQQSKDKDRLANPHKPLVRGVLTNQEVTQGIKYLTIGLCAYGILIAGGLHLISGLLIIALALFTKVYAYHFFLKDLLSRNPYLKICFHHLYAWPMVFLAVSAHVPGEAFSARAWEFGGLIFCSLCVYDLSCQLDPQAHPIRATALNFYGYKSVFIGASTFIILGLFFAFALHFEQILIFIDVGILITFSLLFVNHRLFKITELSCTLSLIIHSWSAFF